MSRQSKNGRKLALARQNKNNKGPSSTTPKHGKVNTWCRASSPTYWDKPKAAKKERDQDVSEGSAFFKKLKEQQSKQTVARVEA